MKHTNRIFALLVALAMLLSFAACTPKEPEVPPTAQELYEQAISKLSVDAQAMDIQVETRTQFGKNTIETVSSQRLVYADLGGEAFSASLQETVQMGDSSNTYQEVYSDGTLYMTLDEKTLYKGQVEADDFMSRFAPVKVLDPALYEQCEILEDGTLFFTQATAGEAWALPEDAVLAHAQGLVKLENGYPAQTDYEISYAIGGVTVEQSFRVVPAFPEPAVEAEEEKSKETEATQPFTPPAPEPVPGDPDTFVLLESIEAIRLVQNAMNILDNCQELNLSISSVTASEAVGLATYSDFVLNLCHPNGELLMEGNQNVVVFTHEGEQVPANIVTRFENGEYTIATEGVDPIRQQGVTEEWALLEVETAIDSHLVRADGFLDAKLTQESGIYYIQCVINDAYSNEFRDAVSEDYTGDPDLIDELSTAVDHPKREYTISVDPVIGLPMAATCDFEAVHTIEDISCKMTLQRALDFRLYDMDIYQNITNEAPEMEAPENPATPLLYRVTGKDGQQMWLFGTIHVGDERTSFLPQEFYDAFDSADALALEFDIAEFTEKMESDPEYVQEVLRYYVYEDGTTYKDHLSQEAGEQMETMLKVIGTNPNLSVYQISILESLIQQKLTYSACNLSGNNGADNRLTDRAQEQEKPILSIESAEEQMEMSVNFSDELQEALLMGTFDTGITQYRNGTWELYEMWCEGDEATLTEYINEDIEAEFKEGEEALYEEYYTAMQTDRNKQMLEAAIEYLEGDTVVFYAVGLAHLLASDGLVHTLRDAGYTVEQVVYQQ